MTDFTTAPVNWDDPQWGHNPVHVAAWLPDSHDSYDPEEGR